MISIHNKRAVTLVSGVASLAVIVLVLAFVSSTGAWAPKCRYPFGGVWIGITDRHPDAWVINTEVPLDITGRREAASSWVQTGDNPQAFDPETVAMIGASQVISTGKYTYKFSQAFYFTNSTTHTKYIFLMTGEGEWVDRDHREEKSWWALYLKSQDADSDGQPDPGQEPIYSSDVWEIYLHRQPMFDLPKPT
jgi:hypothetical protein